MAYLHPSTDSHELCFKDHKKVVLNWDAPGVTECPLCLAHGGWNLRLDCYKFPSEPKNGHFRCICSNCHGSGWVVPRNGEVCLHEWREIPRVKTGPRDCYHEEKCTKCGAYHSYDSGD